MKRFKSFNEAQVNDISVGVKKKLPAGVQGDPNLKGFAYNEKVKFKFKGKNPFKINLEEVELEESKIDVDYIGNDNERASHEKRFNVKISMHGDGMAFVSGEPKDVWKFAVWHYDDAEDAADIHPKLAKEVGYEMSEEVKLEEGRGDVLKSLQSLVKRGGYDKEDFQKALDLYKSAKYKDLRKHIYGLDTDPSETLAAIIAQGDVKAFTSMYPRAKAGDYLRSIVIQHGESVENTFDSIVEDMMVEIELDEALSPKEKEKRLLMIKKAVEKLNKANIDKIKKQAMRDMKASGMFDDVIDEHIKGGGSSHLALSRAREQAKKMGKVWNRMGEDEKERLIDKEMTKLGYEKKPGNQMYTKIPTDKEKAYADQVRAKDKEVSKMSDDDKVDYFSKNPGASTGGHNISDQGKIKIEIARLEKQMDSIEKLAMEADKKAAEAEEEGDDRAFEKFQDEGEYHLERARKIQNKIDDLKDDLKNK